MLDRIPTRCNLDRRVVDLDSTMYPVCNDEVEDVTHLFNKCSITQEVWIWVDSWMDIDVPVFDSEIAITQWLDKFGARLFHVIFLITLQINLF